MDLNWGGVRVVMGWLHAVVLFHEVTNQDEATHKGQRKEKMFDSGKAAADKL